MSGSSTGLRMLFERARDDEGRGLPGGVKWSASASGMDGAEGCRLSGNGRRAVGM